MAEDGNVRVPIREWLERIDTKLENIDLKLDLKADRERVHDLAARVSAQEMYGPLRQQLLDEFKTAKTDIEDLKVWRGRIAGAITLLAALAAVNGLRVWFGF